MVRKKSLFHQELILDPEKVEACFVVLDGYPSQHNGGSGRPGFPVTMFPCGCDDFRDYST